MKRTAVAALSAGMVIALAALVTSSFAGPAPQGAASLAVDADPSSNAATSLGPTDQCVAVQAGDSFQVDVVVKDVDDLLGWEAYVIYDASVLTLTDRDVKLFLAANAGSNVFDASDAPPDTDGSYRVAAADIADPPAPDSGSGVLARLTFNALSPGVSLISLPRLDFAGDGRPDFGPILTAVSGQRIGDSDGDTYFDGTAADAWIAVGTSCPPEAPALPTIAPFTPVTSTALPRPTQTAVPTATPRVTATPAGPNTGPSDDDNPSWALIGGLVGAAAVLAAGGALWWLRRRGRA